MSAQGNRTRGEASRYVIQEQIGSGSVAVVYRAHDRQRHVDVALKTLRLPMGAHLYRFKQEFRSLADIVHPNLVTLYGLESHGDEWFITMELVDGVEFLDHVRPADDGEAEAPDGDEPADATVPLPRSPQSFAPRKRGPLDLAKLRPALRQLADAVHHLHGAGKLHRDIKPSNVLVERGGRVVLCDFGLVIEREPDSETTDEGFVVGTPAYMSPEQASGAELGEASDWYSVGVMLYQALTGRLPFEGATSEILERKQRAEAAPPTGLDELPEDLLTLCMALLSRDPNARPSGASVLDALDAVAAVPQAALASGTARKPLVGREAELGVLRDAFAASRDAGRCVAVLVSGSSGIGKSHLIRRFIAEQRDRIGDLIVLGGRCFESEQLPYKALDPIIDSLSIHLSTLDEAELARVMPRDVELLGRLFPVLRRIGALARTPPGAQAPPDPAELRRRAFGALRFLLRRLGETRPLIVFVDDLHWGDADSASFLAGLIHHPRAPSLLLIGSYGTDDDDARAMLAQLSREDTAGTQGDVRRLTLEPLDGADARALATALAMDAGRAAPAHRLEDMVRDAGGNPLFLAELARHGGVEGARGEYPVSLTLLLQRRIAELPRDARSLLSALAVAARPLTTAVARHVARVEDAAAAIAHLRAERLVRLRPSNDDEILETYHDRIREAACALLGPGGVIEFHMRLARSLEELGDPDPNVLVEHWLAAGDQARAAELALAAAASARAALAFHRAARYYELAIELRDADDPSTPQVMGDYADALAQAGRPEQAAEAYVAAAAGSADDGGFALRQRAVSQFLRAGLTAEGLALAHQILRELGGARVPGTRRRALLALLGGKLRLAARGLEFVERDARDIPPDELRRTDIYYDLALGLAFVDPIVGAAMQTRHLRHALRVGEPHRTARALSLEMAFLSLSGKPGKADALLPSVMALAERVQAPSAVGLATIAIGMSAYVSGQWRRADEYLARGRQFVLDRCSGLWWEADIANAWHMASLAHLGELRKLRLLVPVHLREAEDRGNRIAAAALRSWRGNLAWLVMGDPDEAWRQVDRARPAQRTDERNPHDYYELVSRTRIELYRAEGVAAWSRIDRDWNEIRGTMLHRFPNMWIEILFLRGRAAVAAAVAGHEFDRMMRIAEDCASRLARARLPWGLACADLLTACTLVLRDQPRQAIDRLVSAAVRFERVSMGLLAAVSRLLRGRLVGGDHGAAISAEAVAWMRGEAVEDAESLANVYAPVLSGLG